LNALQHGDASAIDICLTANGVTISNGVVAGSDSAGTGLGLLIVQRWAQRFGLHVLQGSSDASRYVVRVETHQHDID
jgi:signal transduction histidine kinase